LRTTREDASFPPSSSSSSVLSSSPSSCSFISDPCNCVHVVYRSTSPSSSPSSVLSFSCASRLYYPTPTPYRPWRALFGLGFRI
jgi:hypothetical protein